MGYRQHRTGCRLLAEMKPKRPRDMNELAVHIGKIATHEIEDVQPKANPASKRGEARAAKLSPARRKAIAKKAARTRWGKKG